MFETNYFCINTVLEVWSVEIQDNIIEKHVSDSIEKEIKSYEVAMSDYNNLNIYGMYKLNICIIIYIYVCIYIISGR